MDCLSCGDVVKVVNIISDTNVGGAGKCLVNYANNSFDKNIDLYIIVPKNSLLITYFNKNVNVIEIDGLYDKSLDIGATFKLIKIFRTINPDIIHTHSVIVARVVARLFLKCKIIYTKHCYYDLKKYEYNFIVRSLYFWFDKLFSDRIILVTKALCTVMKERGSVTDKMVTIVNGVPKMKNISFDCKNKIRKRYGIKEKDFVVSIIARLVKDKDHETLINVAAMFKEKRINNIKFLIVGTGELSLKLKEIVIKLGLDDIVIFTGFIKNTNQILSVTSLQLNCSIGTETSSLSILEGFSMGIPAVVSNYGGNPYIVKNDVCGYVVNKKDVNDFYNKIKLIKDDNSLYKKLSAGAKKEYEKNYTIKRYVSEINKVYYDVLNK